MKEMLHAGRALLEDLASTLLFLALLALTHDVLLAVAAGMGLALIQIGWRLARRQRIDTLQWTSLFLVIASGSATLFTHDPVFVMLKPSAIYLLIGWAMLQKGWMLRYMPARAVTYLPDLITTFGYVWAGLMFLSAVLNIGLALTLPAAAWGTAITVWSIASKAMLFFAQYGLMKFIGLRRYRAREMLAA